MSLPFLIGGAIVGGVTGWLSHIGESQKEQAKIRQQKELAQKAYEYKSAYDNQMFGLQRGEALETLGIQRNRLADAMGADVAGFNLGLEGQALGSHASRVGLAESAGMARAAQGASGVRGSDSLDRQLGFQEDMFGRQMDLQSRGNSLSLQNMTKHYSNTFSDIGREIDSWGEGGYKGRAKALSDKYAENMHGLEMQGYDNAIEAADWNWASLTSSILGNAGSGAQFGYFAKKAWDEW